MYLELARFAELARWPANYGGLCGLIKFEPRASSSVRRFSEFPITYVLISNCDFGECISKRLGSCVRRGVRVRVWCRGGSWGQGAEVTLSGSLYGGSTGRICRNTCVTQVPS